jgi:hypothetical protein
MCVPAITKPTISHRHVHGDAHPRPWQTAVAVGDEARLVLGADHVQVEQAGPNRRKFVGFILGNFFHSENYDKKKEREKELNTNERTETINWKNVRRKKEKN